MEHAFQEAWRARLGRQVARLDRNFFYLSEVMRNTSLGLREKKLYRMLGSISMVMWLIAAAVYFNTGQEKPWFYISWIGGLCAMAFGFAYKYESHIWPFYLLFKSGENNDGQ